jgi:hypothetical protein
VTHLREMMLEELQRRNYSEITTRKFCPVRRRWREIFHAQGTLTANRCANAARLPSPR